MRIERIEVVPLLVPLAKTVLGGTYQVSSRQTLIVRISTDTGASAEVYVGDETECQSDVQRAIVQDLAPMLVGEDAMDGTRLWWKMFARTREKIGGRPAVQHALRVLLAAISAIDVALWDLRGKALRQPVYKLLGGYRRKLPIIAIGGYYQDGKGAAGIAEEIGDYRERELFGVKFKVGRETIDEDIERLRVAREAAGDDFLIACDANMAWTREQAIEFARKAEPFGLAWLEEPIQWHDQVDGMRAVRAKTSIPICAGQSEVTSWGCHTLMASKSIDILNYDASIGPGITDWLRAAGMAELAGVRLAHHEEPQISSHLLASTRAGFAVECFHPDRDPVWPGILVEKPTIRGGFLHLSDKAGLGLELDPGFLERYRVGVAAG